MPSRNTVLNYHWSVSSGKCGNVMSICPEVFPEFGWSCICIASLHYDTSITIFTQLDRKHCVVGIYSVSRATSGNEWSGT